MCVRSLLISRHSSFTFLLAVQADSLLLTGLQSLQVTHIGMRDAGDDYPGPSWLKQQLQSFLSATRLQCITLKIVVDGNPLSCDDWAAVDSMLDGDAFPGLTRVEINPDLDSYNREPRGQVHDKMRSLFPRLDERKVLDVCWHPWSRYD
jgi:hypothetical protein